MKNEFQECAECAAKPGSPTLCPSCLQNRRIIADQRREIEAFRELTADHPEERKEDGCAGNNQERWECNVCGVPCRIEIEFSDAKLPHHLKGNPSRFRDKRCPCKEINPEWERIN